MENKQTAIQSLIEDIQLGTLSDHIDGVEYFSKDTILEFLERAKQMEKEQIQDAHIEGQRVFDKHPHTQWNNDQAEQYYNETYKK